WLKGVETGINEDAPVKVFVMGINEWRSEQEWPLARTEYTPFYFHSQGQANTRFGDGGLYKEKSQHTATDQFTYDPKNHVPTYGGGKLYDGISIDVQRDYHEIVTRVEVLLITTEVIMIGSSALYHIHNN